jgi:signal transduction protein with GAF and PtsI domain
MKKVFILAMVMASITARAQMNGQKFSNKVIETLNAVITYQTAEEKEGVIYAKLSEDLKNEAVFQTVNAQVASYDDVTLDANWQTSGYEYFCLVTAGKDRLKITLIPEENRIFFVMVERIANKDVYRP